jgi:hypothetical protein
MTSCPVAIVLSLCREKTSRLLRTMRSHHARPAYAHPWGSAWACLALLRSPRPLVLLDVPDSAAVDELDQRVHVLSELSSVVVLTPSHTDVVAMLRAGAINALPRDTSPRELASRIAAERRWLGFSAPRLAPGTSAVPNPGITCQRLPQRVLLEVLNRMPHPTQPADMHMHRRRPSRRTLPHESSHSPSRLTAQPSAMSTRSSSTRRWHGPRSRTALSRATTTGPGKPERTPAA